MYQNQVNDPLWRANRRKALACLKQRLSRDDDWAASGIWLLLMALL